MRAPMLVVDRGLADLGTGAEVALDEDQTHHLRRVLRRADGADVELTDGRGHTVRAVLDGASAVLATDVVTHPPGRPTVTVVHAVPRGRALDEIVRTLTELGVVRVEPVLSARTEARPTGASADRVARRLRAVATAALAQSRGAWAPTVAVPAPLAATPVPDGTVALVADPAAEVGLGDVLGGAAGPDPAHVRLLVGPEGGLTDAEVAEHVAAGWVAARAGATVLRSEHAATVLVAAVLALTGGFDLGGASGQRNRSTS